MPAAPSFEEIFEGLRERVLALSLHVTGNRADAEDALQETFLAVYQGLSRFRGEAQVSTWVYRIAIRAALRVKARRPPKTGPLEMEPASASGRDPLVAHEESKRLGAALGRLSAEHRVVISLFAIEGLSHREIAEILGIPEGTVWSRLHLARKKLAALLESRES